MADIVEKYDIGFVLDYKKNGVKEDLLKWYNEYDYQKMKNNCEILMNQVKSDNQKFISTINEFINLGEEEN